MFVLSEGEGRGWLLQGPRGRHESTQDPPPRLSRDLKYLRPLGLGNAAPSRASALLSRESKEATYKAE
jgi:hypothetical protein